MKKTTSKKNNLYHLLSNHLKENRKSLNSFSSDKKDSKAFKATYKFLLGFNEKEKKEELINNLVNKSNKIYQQIKTMTEAEKRRSNFKKSGAFAFTSFKGINFDKNQNEWEMTENYFKKHYGNNFGNTILMRKINRENDKNNEHYKRCTTFNQILKCSNVYL